MRKRWYFLLLSVVVKATARSYCPTMSRAPIDKLSLTTLAPVIGLLLIAIAGLTPWSATNAGATLDCQTLLLAGEPDPDLNDWPDATPAPGCEDPASRTIAATSARVGPTPGPCVQPRSRA